MAGKPQSWKKVRDERRNENFVGRGEPIHIFTENLQSDTPDYMVISITGEGGVGKSTLLARLASIATSSEYNATVVICDDKQTSPVLAMGHIAKKLAEKGISHKEFDERHKKYGELRQELESDPKVPRGGINLLAMGITDLTIKSLRKTPGVGVFFEYADEKAAGAALSELMQYSISKWGNKDEVKLLREPEQVLTPLFLELIKKAYDDNKIVLMLDVFERTSDALSPWLLMLFNFEYGEFDTRVMFIVSGRESLEQHWTELAGLVCHNSLEPFNLDELRLYLSNHEITDDALVNQIYEDTNGLPVLVELLAAAKPKPGTLLPDVSKDAVERFLQWTPQEDRRQAALYAAIPRQFNKDIISAIFGEDATALFNWLSAQSYVRTNNERGSFYHEKVRELMVRYLEHTEPQKISDIHEKLTAYFQEQQTSLNLQVKESYENVTWQKLDVERIYHMLAVDPNMHLAAATAAFLNSFRWHWQFAEQTAQICVQVGDELQIETIASHGQELLSIHRTYQRDEHSELIEKLTALSNQKGLTSTAKSICYARRARAKRVLGNYEEAIKDYERAIELDSSYSLCYGLGETYRLMGRLDEALQNFNLELESNPTDSDTLTSRALVYRSLGKYDEALNDFTETIEHNPKSDWAIAQRGETYRQAQKYDEALRDYTTATELERVAWYFAGRALTQKQLGRYDEALKDFSSAIEIDPKYEWSLSQRAETYRIKKDYDKAVEDYSKAIEFNQTVAQYWANRGSVYRLNKKYDKAIEDLNQAIILDPNYAWAYANRGEAHRAIDKDDYALEDLNKSIELDQSTAWYWGARGATYRSMYQYDNALRDLEKAVELDPKDEWAIAQRAETYRSIGKYDNAITDFTSSMDIDPKYIYALVRRGTVFQNIHKYDDAFRDFSHALEIEPDSVWALVERGDLYNELNEYAKALEDYDRALEIDSKYKYGMVLRGITYRNLRRYEDALSDFSNCIAIDEKYKWAVGQKGITYRATGRFYEALNEMNLMLELDHKYTWGLGQRGMTYRKMGEYDKALEDFNAAITINPQEDWIHNQIGVVYRHIKSYEEALKAFNKAIEINSNNATARGHRARTFQRTGRYLDAIKEVTHAINVDPRDSWLFGVKSEIKFEQSEFSDVVIEMDKAISFNPTYYYGIVLRSAALMKLGNKDKAIQSIQSVLSLEPVDLWDCYCVAVAFLLSHETDRAIDLLKISITDNDNKVFSITDKLLDPIRDLPEFKALYG